MSPPTESATAEPQPCDCLCCSMARLLVDHFAAERCTETALGMACYALGYAQAELLHAARSEYTRRFITEVIARGIESRAAELAGRSPAAPPRGHLH